MRCRSEPTSRSAGPRPRRSISRVPFAPSDTPAPIAPNVVGLVVHLDLVAIGLQRDRRGETTDSGPDDYDA